MDIAYDTEFIDNGVTIRLISIGMVRADGKEYYAINQDRDVLLTAAQDPWLRENVLDSLPLVQPLDVAYPVWDESHPDFIHIKDRTKIAVEVARFILEYKDPSLWAWFAAYDHVVMAQLFGKMIHLPAGIPMRTNDVAQEAERLKLWWRLPKLAGINQHNALDDAREVMMRLNWLREQEKMSKASD